ncbi:MAG: hypothetical protein IJ422_07310, partial [Oscillospiraceae bacterium]|nr:hypothetical protein [Oscillospiraceae bacterium]
MNVKKIIALILALILLVVLLVLCKVLDARKIAAEGGSRPNKGTEAVEPSDTLPVAPTSNDPTETEPEPTPAPTKPVTITP